MVGRRSKSQVNQSTVASLWVEQNLTQTNMVPGVEIKKNNWNFQEIKFPGTNSRMECNAEFVKYEAIAWILFRPILDT